MTKFLTAAAAAALIAGAAQAQDATLDINLEATVPVSCGVDMYSGLIGDGARDVLTDDVIDPAPDDNGVPDFASAAVIDIPLGEVSPADEFTIGSLQSVCNTQNAETTISTTNDFNLVNGSSEIPYQIVMSEGTFASGQTPAQRTFTQGGANLPNGDTTTVKLEVLNFSAFAVTPDVAHTDTVTFTVAPQI